MTRADFSWAVLIYCAQTSGSLSSSWRHPVYNAAVGGVEHSAHQYAVGADVRYLWQLPPDQVNLVRQRFGIAWNPPTPMPLAEREERARRLGLKLIDEGVHDHLQPLDWRAG